MRTKKYRAHVLASLLAVCCLLLFSGLALAEAQVIKISAKKFSFTPAEIVLRKGVPVVLEITTQDRLHGFNCPELGLRADIQPGQVARLELTPSTAGRFEFHCDIFCGDGHEEMNGAFVVK